MITLCKCGQTIYDEPEQRYDKCRSCMAKSFKTKAESNLFLSGNFYERRNMREQIAEIIQRGAGDISFGYGEYAAPLYHKQIISPIADQILNLISEEIEKVENPYDKTLGISLAFEYCRQKILNLFRPKENVATTDSADNSNHNVVGSVEDF